MIFFVEIFNVIKVNSVAFKHFFFNGFIFKVKRFSNVEIFPPSLYKNQINVEV